MFDWHGHNDRGLGVVRRYFTAALCRRRSSACHCPGRVGERVGNAAMDQLLINLKLNGWTDVDLSGLARYCELAAANDGHLTFLLLTPPWGTDAFRTGTGGARCRDYQGHQKKGDTESWPTSSIPGSPPHILAGRQIIELGPMSGQSNVIFWLEERQH